MHGSTCCKAPRTIFYWMWRSTAQSNHMYSITYHTIKIDTYQIETNFAK